MYLWRIQELKRRLKVRPLSEKEVLPYVIAIGVITCLALAFPPERPNHWDMISGLLQAVVTAGGTYWVYQQNGGASGVEFLQRYTALGWVMFLRVLPALAVIVGAIIIARTGPMDMVLETSGRDTLVYVTFSVVYYQRLGAHVRHVALSTTA